MFAAFTVLLARSFSGDVRAGCCAWPVVFNHSSGPDELQSIEGVVRVPNCLAYVERELCGSPDRGKRAVSIYRQSICICICSKPDRPSSPVDDSGSGTTPCLPSRMARGVEFVCDTHLLPTATIWQACLVIWAGVPWIGGR